MSLVSSHDRNILYTRETRRYKLKGRTTRSPDNSFYNSVYVNQSLRGINRSNSINARFHKSVKRSTSSRRGSRSRLPARSSNSPVQPGSTQVTGFPSTFCSCFTNRLLPGFLLSPAFCSLSLSLFFSIHPASFHVSPRYHLSLSHPT